MRTYKSHYNATINRRQTSLAIPDNNWIELETMDVLLIRKNPVYLFLRFNTGTFYLFHFEVMRNLAWPHVDPILTEINERLQDINDDRSRFLGPTPLGSGSFGHVFPLGSKSRFMTDENWELRALKVLNIRSQDSFQNILRGVSTFGGGLTSRGPSYSSSPTLRVKV